MTLDKLTTKERNIIGECLKAAVEGPFFQNWEFHSLFGIDRGEVAAIVKAWPNIDESNETVRLAINNSIANLIGYPHGKQSEWKKYISATPQEALAIFRKWKSDNQTE